MSSVLYRCHAPVSEADLMGIKVLYKDIFLNIVNLYVSSSYCSPVAVYEIIFNYVESTCIVTSTSNVILDDFDISQYYNRFQEEGCSSSTTGSCLVLLNFLNFNNDLTHISNFLNDNHRLLDLVPVSAGLVSSVHRSSTALLV